MDRIFQREHEGPIVEIIKDLRQKLQAHGIGFGALFVGKRIDQKLHFGFLFAEGMPQTARMEMLNDMQQALEESRKIFQQ